MRRKKNSILTPMKHQKIHKPRLLQLLTRCCCCFLSVVCTLWWWSGTVHKLYPGALTDDGVSLFEVGLPIYEEGKERIELKMLTRKDMFKVFDAHYYFSYTVYEHYYEYSPTTTTTATTATPITSCYNVRPQDSGEDVSLYYCSVFYLSFYQSFCSI